ncbi:hypothetical protein JCM5353_007416 [Sporobolomyces roseus]
MAKKAPKEVSAPTSATPVPSRDALQRLSYLYQASVILNNAGLDTSERPRKKRRTGQKERSEIKADQEATENAVHSIEGSEVGVGGEQARKEGTEVRGVRQQDLEPTEAASIRTSRGKQALRPVSRHLVRMMREVAKKATVRMDPEVKRSVCKDCDAVLIPGISASVRIKASGPHAHLMVQTCSTCFGQRRFPAPPHLLESGLNTISSGAASTDEARLTTSAIASDKKPRQTKREKKEQRQAQPPVFFERTGHVVIKGGEVLRRNEYGERE